jgi:hypothetical protein
MIEGLINVMTPAGQGRAAEAGSDETTDSLALAGAEAIKRSIAERNNLRACTSAQQRDLVAMNAINEELRRRLAIYRHQYVEFATKILAQLEQFDQATREVAREHAPSAAITADDEESSALAERLKPANGTTKPAAE